MNLSENITQGQLELLELLLYCDKEGMLPEPGLIVVLFGDDKYRIPHCLNEKTIHLQDLVFLCEIGYLTQIEDQPNLTYRISNNATDLLEELYKDLGFEEDLFAIPSPLLDPAMPLAYRDVSSLTDSELIEADLKDLTQVEPEKIKPGFNYDLFIQPFNIPQAQELPNIEKRKPSPFGGTLHMQIRVSNGTVPQVHNLLRTLNRNNLPKDIHLFENEEYDSCWEIIVSNKGKAGYIRTLDLPIIPIKFFSMSEDFHPNIEAVAHVINNQLIEYGFEVVDSSRAEQPNIMDTAVTGIQKPVIDIAQNIAWNTTGVTKRVEVLGQSLDTLQERSERLARIEGGENPFQPTISQTEDKAIDLQKKKLSSTSTKNIFLQTKPSGRPPDPDYDEAFNQLSQGKPYNDVFHWFCERKGWGKPTKSDRDAFKAAMKRRRKGT